MPIGFLTTTERDHLNHFPTPIPDEDLRAFFLLSEADQHIINHQREAHTRLGFALQLCALRYLGFAPDDLSTTPEEAVFLRGPPTGRARGGHSRGWPAGENSHHPFPAGSGVSWVSTATPLDVYALQTWLGERALEHDKPSLLLQLACDKLRREQIVRPGLTRLERLVATARHAAHTETFRRLTPLLTDARPTVLDDLLVPDPHTGRTGLNWLRREATAASAPQLVETLTKVSALLDMGIATWDLTALNPNRVKWLAQLGWKAPVPQLQRMDPARRYPILVAFLAQALAHHIDVAIGSMINASGTTRAQRGRN